MDANLSLRTDQIADLAYYMANQKCLNLSDAGTGKTPPTCVMQWWLWSTKGVGTVWVMPLSLLRKNRGELLRWTGFTEDEVVIVEPEGYLWPKHGKTSTRKREIIEALRKGQSVVDPKYEKARASLVADGFILDGKVHEERVHARQNGIPRIVVEPGQAKVFLMGPDMLSRIWRYLPDFVKAVHVDEWHKCFKTDSAARTQELYKLMHKLGNEAWFVPMTGTIISGRLDSAYPAIRIIEPRYYGSYQSFLNQHEVTDIMTGKRTGWRNHEKLAAIFGKHGIRHTFDEVHGKTAKIIEPEYVDMSIDQREMYDKFKDQAFLELEKFFVDGTQPGVAFIRARQIMEHPNEFPDLTTPGQFLDIMKGSLPGKEERLQLHFEDHKETGKPVVVFAALVPQQRRIRDLAEKCGLRATLITGTTSPAERARIDQAFQAGEIDCLVCSPEVADVGFNWQFAGDTEVEHVIFASLPFLDTTVRQAIQRMVRGKRSTPLRITVLLYSDSLDHRIVWIVHQKSIDAHKVDPTNPVIDLSKYHNTEDDLKQAA